MNIAVPSFGDSPKWAKMLEVWMDFYRASGCSLPVTVVTDTHWPAPRCVQDGHAKMIRFNPDNLPCVLRDGMPFDRQGSLICQAILYFGRCVIMDSDALMQHDPTKAFLSFPAKAVIGMAPDAGGRRFMLDGEAVLERNGGVLYFGEVDMDERMALVQEYQDTFAQLRATQEANPILEQLVFSAMWHRAGRTGRAYDIARTLNHSRLWGLDDRATIRHEHGRVKWHRVEGGLAHA